MSAQLIRPADVARAVEIYLQIAYPDSVPLRAHAQQESLQTWQGDLFECGVLVRDPKSPTPRYNIRVGNQIYPHMKIAMELPPNGTQFLFRVDTHDHHCCPGPTSPEYAAFTQLMAKNQQFADRIEAAWEAAGIPTFKSFLKEDLARRRAALQR